MSGWHFKTHNTTRGPFTDEQLKALCDTGTVNAATLVWRANQADWLPLAHSDFAYKSSLPPLPPLPAGEPSVAPRTVESDPELGFFAYGWRALTKKYATFSGRARRKEIWSLSVIQFPISAVLVYVGAFMDQITGNIPERGGEPFYVLVFLLIAILGFLLPNLACSARRLHDLGASGWFALVIFVPYIGVILALLTLLLPGQPHENAYGPPPKPVPA
jgi:uncharacterized membrane protein YhaH (DUF805 family)